MIKYSSWWSRAEVKVASPDRGGPCDPVEGDAASGQTMGIPPEGIYSAKVLEVGEPTISQSGRACFLRVKFLVPGGIELYGFFTGTFDTVRLLHRTQHRWIGFETYIRVRHNQYLDRIYASVTLTEAP